MGKDNKQYTSENEQDLQLQANIETAASRLSDKRAELAATEKELAEVINSLPDASKETRPGLLARRRELMDLRSLLSDETAALSDRYDAARLAVYELAEARADAEVKRLGEIARDARLAMNGVIDTMRRFRNGPNRGGQTDEDARKLVELEVEQAKKRGESFIADRNAARAKYILEHARQELAEVREELGAIPKAGAA